MTKRVASARIVVVDDSEPFRSLLVYFDDESRLEVVGYAADGVEAEHVIDLTDPDVVVLDARLPLESGLEVLEKLRETHPETMFAWAPIPEPYRELGSIEFAKLVVRDANVALSPGVGFGPGGDGYVRFALIENEQRINQAVRNLRKGLPKL